MNNIETQQQQDNHCKSSSCSNSNINNNNDSIAIPVPPPQPIYNITRVFYPLVINRNKNSTVDSLAAKLAGQTNINQGAEGGQGKEEENSYHKMVQQSILEEEQRSKGGNLKDKINGDNNNNGHQPSTQPVTNNRDILIFDTQQIYNIMQDIAIPKLLIDLRTKQEFENMHIKTAVNIPPPTLEEIDEESLASFNLTKYIAVHCPTAKYWNLIMSRVVIYTDSEIDSGVGKTLVQDDLDAHYNSDTHPLATRHSNVWFNYVLHYLYSRCKKTKVCIYQNGFQAFNNHYPFLCRGVSDTQSNKAYRNIPDSSLYPSEILTDFLYLGAYENASSRTQLDNLKINYIVNMASELDDVFPHLYKYYRADLDDNFRADIGKHIEPINQFIEEARKNDGRVLVHCAMGISRSTTAVLAYLMKYHHFNYADARNYVKVRRSIIQPNFGFVKYLHTYDEELRNTKVIVDSLEDSDDEPSPSSLKESSSTTSSNPLNHSSESLPIITNSEGCVVTINSSL